MFDVSRSFFPNIVESTHASVFFCFVKTFRLLFLQHVVKVNDTVWAKWTNGRYYQARVAEVKTLTTFCICLNGDNSFIQDIKSDDILTKKEKFLVGDEVVVRLHDGDLYEGEFVAKKSQLFYNVSKLIRRCGFLLRSFAFTVTVDHSLFAYRTGRCTDRALIRVCARLQIECSNMN